MNGKTYASRMPFTVNMVFSYGDDGKNCRDVASRWRIDGLDKDEPPVAARRLLQGPLDFSKLTFKQMEINAQVVALSIGSRECRESKIRGPGNLLDEDICAQERQISAHEAGEHARRAGNPERSRQAEAFAGISLQPHGRHRQRRLQPCPKV